MRKECDKLGSVPIEDNCEYGINTARAVDNFNIGGRSVNLELIYGITIVKKAAALTNKRLKTLDNMKCDAIIFACDEILKGLHDDSFVTNALQGGAGTSTNMNINEVIANIGLKYIGHHYGEYEYLDPLDDVNKCQSTNDVYPTGLRIAAIKWVRKLSEDCSRLQESLQIKEQEFEDVIKLGRTQLMDALPIALGQEFGAYAQAISRDRWRIYKVEERLRQVNLGGTAVGTGTNANRKFTYKIIEEIRNLTGYGLARAEYPMDLTQNNDVFVEVSGLLKALAVNLMKICNDLRLMNSGPYGGFGEISLEARQAGSTIMPGKVNPVIPEMMTQTAIKVMANDQAISICAASGQLELNAFTPLIADSILDSLIILTRGINIFREKCINGIIANKENCRKHLDSSMVLVTALAPYIGYNTSAEIFELCKGHPQKIREVVLNRGLMEEDKLSEVLEYRHASTYI